MSINLFTISKGKKSFFLNVVQIGLGGFEASLLDIAIYDSIFDDKSLTFDWDFLFINGIRKTGIFLLSSKSN